ncbi:ArsA family ATPase [Myxococcota bacterium]
MRMIPLDRRRFLLVTGKGGVGKTTTTAALAVALGHSGRRVLVAACDERERLSNLFGVPPLTGEIRPLQRNIFGVKLIPADSMREYGALKLRSWKVFSAVFNRRTVQRFLAGVPGLSEWAMLGKAWYHSTEMGAHGQPRFDVVLFDAPATGHALDMLRVPLVILDVAPPGILRRDAEHALTMFRDPSLSGVVVVALPEELPATETLELVAALRTDLRLPIARLVVNAVVETLFTPEERQLLGPLVEMNASTPADAAVLAAAYRAVREQVQAEAMERLAQLDCPWTVLPFLTNRAGGQEAVSRLAKAFLGSWQTPATAE